MHHDSGSAVLFFAFPPLFPYGSRNTVHRITANVECMPCRSLVSATPRLAWEGLDLDAVNILAQVLADVP